ncbi:plasmid replication protein RepC [Aliirhizobium cellulosilyticum]|uniref:Replication initiation protein RepC n=1 Tax=Aliirhizobium cellulosilyticum TaxID=393664 RepID=A0A7W6SEF9_9HYPH|nr:plasmid replication protein RepC [Rhizobium cellulosilyticum]MBB4351597.1 replication initiation protein RepC [Rhizobium cellulosilyticum]MBB4414849.1 replication initiation protein RepC [Rhizobium cellulosilyticum]MBB4449523.1 replication initiation protein RepC [Rhizobium cellulosilyticum]
MQIGNVTTPFGRRPMTLALVKGQLDAPVPRQGRTVEKWKVFRDVAEARQLLGLQDRALAVLDALLTFYPSNELKSDGSLVVFPSNAQLSVRAHGITGSTLRRHLAALVDAGLIHRRDSPNGKRYVHRDGNGQIEQAFGFDLEPLMSRAAELAGLAQQVAEEGRAFRRSKEALTLCRRDVRKLISAAMEEGADGDWEAIEEMYVSILSALPRSPNRQQLENVLEDMGLLREEIINRLELQLKSEKTDTNDGHSGRHIQNSKPESIYDLEPRSEEEQGATVEPTKPRVVGPIKAFPLGMVLRACPQISDYSPGGGIASWRDLMAAAVLIRSMLGVSPSAYQEACEVMGPENAAATMACILERGGHINSAGGYLRDLTARSRRGEFSLGPVLMALLRSHPASARSA